MSNSAEYCGEEPRRRPIVKAGAVDGVEEAQSTLPIGGRTIHLGEISSRNLRTGQQLALGCVYALLKVLTLLLLP